MMEEEPAQTRGLEPEWERPVFLALTWEQRMLKALAILAQVAQPAPWPCRPRRYSWCDVEGEAGVTMRNAPESELTTVEEASRVGFHREREASRGFGGGVV